MRRLCLLLSIVVVLAACSSAPQLTARRGGSHPSGRVYETRPPGFPDFVDHSVGREEISIEAMGLVGIPYRWGGNTPDSGFDCSGLVHYVLARAADVNLPRTTAQMSTRGEPIQPDQIASGDLVFFNTTGRPHSHVGIYVGKLRFVNAPSTGGTVRIDYLTNPYWAKRFDGIRRAAPARRAPTLFDAPTYQASTPSTPSTPAVAVAAAPAAPQTAPAPAPAPIAPATPVASVAPTAAVAGAGAEQSVARTAPATPPTPVRAAQADAGAPPPDAFEPPPQAMSAAQRQALAAGAVSPPVEPGTVPTTAPTAAVNAAPDPIDAAADAFEPAPPAAVAARQAQQARASEIPVTRASTPADLPPPSSGPVEIWRASTAARGTPAPTQSSDDPIARFANGGY